MRQRQGMILVVVLLLGMMLLTCFALMASSLAVNLKQLKGDKELLLSAEYAAQSGLALLEHRLNEAAHLIQSVNIAALSHDELKLYAQIFCGVDELYQPPSRQNQAFRLCTAGSYARPEVFFQDHVSELSFAQVGLAGVDQS